MVVLALLNAVWRGGSTMAEQLLFSTTVTPPFLLDEPANARWPQHSAVTSNLHALCCDFSQHNVTQLLRWEYWRGMLSDQVRALSYDSLADLKQHCHGSSVRAVKTIRMKGELASFAEACRELASGHGSGESGLNVSCVIIQLVRHPRTTLISQSPFNKTLDADSLCRPILQDVRAAEALQAERVELEAAASASASAHAALVALPRVSLVKYDELLSAPEATVRAIHAQLRVRTSPAKLASFLLGHLSLNRSQLSAELRRHAPPPTPPPSPPSPSSQRPGASPRGTARPPLVSKFGSSSTSAFGTVREPRVCESTDAMVQWPVCAELVRRLHPLHVC